MTDAVSLQIVSRHAARSDAECNVLRLPNDADPMSLPDGLVGVERVELHFPHFTDGRAYSQAYLIRRRLGFTGDLRATGDIQIDQLIQIARTGFSSAVLNDGLDLSDASRQLQRFSGFYQADASTTQTLRVFRTVKDTSVG